MGCSATDDVDEMIMDKNVSNEKTSSVVEKTIDLYLSYTVCIIVSFLFY